MKYDIVTERQILMEFSNCSIVRTHLERTSEQFKKQPNRIRIQNDSVSFRNSLSKYKRKLEMRKLEAFKSFLMINDDVD